MIGAGEPSERILCRHAPRLPTYPDLVFVKMMPGILYIGATNYKTNLL